MCLVGLIILGSFGSIGDCRLALQPCRDSLHPGEPLLIRVSVINPSAEDIIIKEPFAEGVPPHLRLRSPDGKLYSATSGLAWNASVRNRPWALRANSSVSTFVILSAKIDKARKTSPALTAVGEWKITATFNVDGHALEGETKVSVIGEEGDLELVRDAIGAIDRSRWQLHTPSAQSAIEKWRRESDEFHVDMYRSLRDLFRASSNAVALREIPATREELIAHLACEHTMCRDFVLQQLAKPLIDRGATAEARRVLDAVSVPTVESQRSYGRIDLHESRKQRLEEGGK